MSFRAEFKKRDVYRICIAYVFWGLLIIPSTLYSTTETETPKTPNENDIPRPVQAELTLAGSSQPDILRYLNVRMAKDPSLSPDGKQLAFNSSITGIPQLWVVESKSGWPKQLTFGESVTFHKWSPTGEWIIYGTDLGGNEQEGYYLISPDGSIEVELLPPSNTFRVFGDFTRDGKKIAYSQSEGGDNPSFDVHLLDIASRKSSLAFQGRPGLYVQSWRPDGGAVILSEAVGEDAENIYLFEIENKRLTTLFRPDDPSGYKSFSWVPDGSGFYLTSNQGREFLNLAFYEVETGELNFLEDQPYDVTEVTLTNDGKFLAWIGYENGYSKIHCSRMNTKLPPHVSNQLEAPLIPKGIYNLRWSASSHFAAIFVQNPQVAGDIWSWDADSNETYRSTLSATAGLDMNTMIIPDHYDFKARDGLTIHGLLYLPHKKTGDSPPPVLLSVHGGPTIHAKPVYEPEFQYLLEKGIAVFDLNYRGSTGYGKTFARLNDKRLRALEYLDMADAIDWLGGKGLVDSTRAGVMGESYGGYLTMAAMARLPGTFKAGIALVGVSNWISALEGASPQLKASDRYEYGDINDPDDRKFFTEISPVTYVDNITSPIMVIHGANDPRDPPTESDQFVQAIRENGGMVEYLRFPDEGHAIRKLSNQIIEFQRIADFLELHLSKQVE